MRRGRLKEYGADLATRVVSPADYAIKKITVTVKATTGPFPGLRQTRQSVFVRFRDATLTLPSSFAVDLALARFAERRRDGRG